MEKDRSRVLLAQAPELDPTQKETPEDQPSDCYLHLELRAVAPPKGRSSRKIHKGACKIDEAVTERIDNSHFFCDVDNNKNELTTVGK
eukprot:IDg9205t1